MKLVMNMVRKSFKKGDVIFDISEKSDDLYLINSGMVQIESSEGMVLATLAKGEMFGEMASIPGERERTARAVALETAVIDAISPNISPFDRVASTIPSLDSICAMPALIR